MSPVTLPAQPVQDEFALAVKVALLQRGLTVTELARTLGFARVTVSQAINHPTLLPGVKSRIREALSL